MPLTARVIPCVLLPTTSILLILTTRTVLYRICGGKKLKNLYQQNSYFALSQGKN